MPVLANKLYTQVLCGIYVRAKQFTKMKKDKNEKRNPQPNTFTHTSKLIFVLNFAVTRVRSQGHVTVSLSVVTKDLWKQGYRNGASEPHTSGPSVVRDLNTAVLSRPFSHHNRTAM